MVYRVGVMVLTNYLFHYFKSSLRRRCLYGGKWIGRVELPSLESFTDNFFLIIPGS